jgi:hypothetical protein
VTILGLVLGGGFGALARYQLEGPIAPRQRSPFHLSTLIVNVSGSFFLGWRCPSQSPADCRSRLLYGLAPDFSGRSPPSPRSPTRRSSSSRTGRAIPGLEPDPLGPLSFGAAAVSYVVALWTGRVVRTVPEGRESEPKRLLLRIYL